MDKNMTYIRNVWCVEPPAFRPASDDLLNSEIYLCGKLYSLSAVIYIWEFR